MLTPLALKVIGSSLRKKHVSLWEATIRKLEEIPNPEIHKILQISYDSLKDDADKRLFLHLACFFNKYDKDFIITILDHCGLHPVVGIQNLMDRCLLVVENNKVIMHQLIQEMGREIVRQESPENLGERSRLWEHQDSFSVLRENMGSNRIEGLILDMDKLEKDVLIEPIENADHQEKCWHEKLPLVSYVSNWITAFKYGNESDLKTNALERMDNLMLLHLNNVKLSGSYSKLPKRLRWLRWYGFPLKSMNSEIPLKKLVVLEMCYSKLVLVWNGFKSIPSLKILDLSYSKELVRTPNFKGLPSLNSMILKGCVSLIEVCESVKDLKKLVLMDLEDCTSLTNIPYLPTSLQTLKISNCFLQSIGALSSNFECSSSLPQFLVNLSLRGCHLSEHCFPADMSHLLSLVHLDLSENPITTLPHCIRSLSSLKVLCVDQCSQLHSVAGVPNTIRELSVECNDSLQRVVLDPSIEIIYFNARGSFNLKDANGLFKLALRENVEKKIIRFLGLESIPVGVVNSEPYGEQNVIRTINLPIQVLYEFGIFSTYVYEDELPECFTFSAKSKHLAFKVPSLPGDRKICGFSLCSSLGYFAVRSNYIVDVKVEIHNTTRGIKWVYVPTSSIFRYDNPDFVWLSLWKCGDFLEIGDEVQIHIHAEYFDGYKVKECGVNLIYEDLMLEEEEWGAREIGTYPRLSWTSKLFVEISNYCNNGKGYFFNSRHSRVYHEEDNESRLQYVDWWGPWSHPRRRRIFGSFDYININN